MYRRLKQIQSELKEHRQVDFERRSLSDVLLLEADSIISSIILASQQEIMLQFEADQRTIIWNGGRIQLGHKSWLFVKALWNGQNHACSVEKIERVVWDDNNRKKRLVKVGNRTIKTDTVSRNTFNSFLYRLKTELCGKFPYKIVPVKSCRTHEIAAYRLKRTKLCIKNFQNAQ
jgi:hypothetical protein